MAKTYEPIATYTVPSAQASYTFSSIPSTYTDLVLISVPLTTASAVIQVRLNGDTATNYSNTYMQGDGTTASSSRSSGDTAFPIAYSTATTTPYTAVTHFMNYSNTTTYKTAISRSSAASVVTLEYVDLWRSTAAINSIQLLCSGGASLNTGAVFTLYGIKAA